MALRGIAMKPFLSLVFLCVGAGLTRILQFFLEVIARNVDQFHMASADSLSWPVKGDLILLALQSIAVGVPLVLGIAFLLRKLISSKLTSPFVQEFAMLAGVIVGAWFWPS